MSARNSLAAKAQRRARREERHANRPPSFGRYGNCTGCRKYRVVFTAPICGRCARRLAEAIAGLFGWRQTLTIRPSR